MKNKLFMLIAIFTFIFIPGKVFAISGNINLSCQPTAAFPGDVITCTISGDVTDGSISEFAATTKVSDNLEIAGATGADDWAGGSSGGIFSLTASNSKSDSFEIASFTVKVKEDSTTSGTITVTPTKLGDISTLNEVSQTITMSTNVEDTAQESTTDTSNTTDIKNPETGSNIPFIILGSGFILIIIFYQIATKNKKIHKI